MDRMEIEQTVLAVLRVVLKQPFDGNVDITRHNTPTWDSLKHLEVMFAIEDELDVTFTEEELARLDSLEKIVELIWVKNAP